MRAPYDRPMVGAQAALPLDTIWARARRRVSELARGWDTLSLAARFLLANLLVLLGAGVVLGAWVGQQIEMGVLTRTAAVTALYVDSVVSPELQGLARSGTLDESRVQTLDRLTVRADLGQHIVSLKIWATDGTVLYSPVRSLIGAQFPVEGGLARAVRGEVAAEMSDLSEQENGYERTHWTHLVEIYAPVRADVGGEILGVMEIYQLPTDLEAEVRSSQLRSWGIVALTMAVTYGLFAGIVRGGSDTIARQGSALAARVLELQRVLAENRRLQTRIAQAARRSTTLNELSRRRISADLHDGPGQVLALALLRLEDGPSRGPISEADLATVRRAVNDALVDIRAIAADLRMPALAPLAVRDIAERAIYDHERRTGTAVRLDVGELRAEVPLATKIALLRTLQEALSNATRHGKGLGVTVRLRAEDRLQLEVSDAGPGFDPTAPEQEEHLGIAGMRERTEILGGSFSITSTPGAGTTVRAAWPLLDAPEDAE